VAARFDYIALQRQWARLAVGPYAAATVLSALLAVRWHHRAARRPLRARTVLALAVLTGALLVPLALEVAWRARHGDRLHIQSEVFLTEEGARALLHGSDPYSASYRYGLLRSYPSAVWRHIPYLPAVFAFGLPRALLGPGPLTDARVGFTAVAVTAALLALALCRASGAQRLRALTVLLALPTGARYLTGGGDDIAVLGLLVLTMVLEHRRRPMAAGVAAGLAAAIKQTAWLPLPFLALAARDQAGRRATWRFLAAAALVVVPVVAPFAVWDLHTLLDSVVLFPLGLTSEPTTARGLTLGQLLATPFPHAKGVTAVVLAGVVVGVGLLLAVKRPPASARDAARHASIVLGLAILLAPAGRFGYLIYPTNLLVWSRVLPQPSNS